ncbi:MAG: valine--tRNA ligase [Bacteroidales bacterium]|nr:valine--tRNA ligase [Bacteroidales bacterium]
MQIPSKYDPATVEDKWYAYWLKNKIFKSEPDSREPYCIVIPPPNVTGVLHMGHMLNNTIQDILVRRARMKGKNACWLPGTDHASIATEAKVVAKLKAEGIDKKSISREEFLAHAWEWKEKHGGIILEQLKKLGASCDWERTKFTMDKDLSESVIDVFVNLYRKGLIYRGVRMVNWDPKALTAVSDEEVIYKELNSKFYYIKYYLEDSSHTFITIATTRPETILGDTAVCVNPNDERYKSFIGKKVLVPLINRPVKIIADEYVEMEFGTGALKVTPAHDINDYNLGIKHNLETIDIFNDNGTLNEKAQLYIGLDRFEVREKIVEELYSKGFLLKTEEVVNKVGFSERTDEVIEPKLSVQWFCKMEEMGRPALEVVENDTIRFHPAKFKNTYRHWMENIRDWCISRQLWWGHRIPAYYLPDGHFVVAKTIEDALAEARKTNPDLQMKDLKQDDDVLDTWFSSWLWPISVFDGIRKPNNKDIKYYYPTDDLITAPEILFFWVARMIMAGLEFRGEIPFKNVYLTGIVRDKLNRKMSKSLGNSPDPIELMKIYGADGVRVGMLFCSAAGNDLLYDNSLCEQGRNFSNKLWNAFRLIKGWEIDSDLAQPQTSKVASEWFNSVINKNLETLEDHFEKYRLSEALMLVYKLIRDDYCSWYLEMIKPPYQKPADLQTYNEAIAFMEKLLKILHPFMPFITEEIWHLVKDEERNSISLTEWPKPSHWEQNIITQFDYVQDIISEIRNVRKEKNIPQKDTLSLSVKKNYNEASDDTFDCIVAKLCNIEKISYIDEKLPNAIAFIIKNTEFYIPLNDHINIEEELKKLNEELSYTKGFLNAVMKKLSNKSFVDNAPEQVVDIEKKKRNDAEARIKVLEEQILNLKK